MSSSKDMIYDGGSSADQWRIHILPIDDARGGVDTKKPYRKKMNGTETQQSILERLKL